MKRIEKMTGSNGVILKETETERDSERKGDYLYGWCNLLSLKTLGKKQQYAVAFEKTRFFCSLV